MPKQIVVVGGGISGLAAAERLLSAAGAGDQLRITVLEASPRVGGVIRTDREGGFLLEAGPDVILAAKPAGIELCERLGIADRVLQTRANGSSILDGRALRRIPEGMNGIVPSRIGPFLSTPLISPIGKVRVALEYLLPARQADDDETVEHFVVRRLGREMYERLVEPLLSGIFAGDGARLSIGATFPQLRALEREHGSLIRGMIANRSGATSSNRPSGLVSLRGGLGEMVDALAGSLLGHSSSHDVSIRRNVSVRQIARAPGGDGYLLALASGETIDADAIVVATPAHAAARMLGAVDASLVSELDAIEYASTVTINVAYRAEDVPRTLEGTGYTVPRALGRPVLACTFTSNKFDGRAPAGRALFRLFFGGAGRADFTQRADGALLVLVRAELREVLGVVAEPVLVRINRFDRVMPQYTVGHLARLARIDQAVARHPGLALAGNAYRGVGIPDCITSGRRAADSVLAAIRSGSQPVSRMAS
jgi:oxygen-dependent protoporphyrinogen oxidase